VKILNFEIFNLEIVRLRLELNALILLFHYFHTLHCVLSISIIEIEVILAVALKCAVPKRLFQPMNLLDELELSLILICCRIVGSTVVRSAFLGVKDWLARVQESPFTLTHIAL